MAAKSSATNSRWTSAWSTGNGEQLRKRYATEKAARAALDAVRGEVAKGTYVHPSKITLAEACEDWLAAKHGLKPSTLHGHRVNLAAAIHELGDIEVQKLTKRHIDDLVTALRSGGLPSPTGKQRKAWSPRSVNYMLGLLTAVLEEPDCVKATWSAMSQSLSTEYPLIPSRLPHSARTSSSASSTTSPATVMRWLGGSR